MTAKELYEKYKGRIASLKGIKGVVCGYGRTNLMVAISDDCQFEGLKVENLRKHEIIKTHTNNKQGYVYVLEEDIID